MASTISRSSPSRPPPEESPGLVDGNAVEREDDPIEESQLYEVTADLQKNIKVLNDVDLQFSIHRSSGRLMVTVTDEETGRVIREIPEREMLDLAARVQEMVGRIFDRKV